MSMLSELYDALCGRRILARNELFMQERSCKRCGKKYRIQDYADVVSSHPPGSGDRIFIEYLQGKRVFFPKSSVNTRLLETCLEC